MRKTPLCAHGPAGRTLEGRKVFFPRRMSLEKTNPERAGDKIRLQKGIFDMNYTQNYHLPQWVESDRVLMEDFNDACVTLENTLTDHGQTLDTLQAADAANTAAHAHFGNCQLYLLSYVGTGGSSCAFSVPGNPVMAMALGASQAIWGMRGLSSGASFFGGDSCLISVSLTQGAVSWTSSLANQGACNSQGFPFVLLVLLEK